MTTPAVLVGIELSKDRLNLALRPTGERWAVAKEEAGIADLVPRLRHPGPHADRTGGRRRARATCP